MIKLSDYCILFSVIFFSIMVFFFYHFVQVSSAVHKNNQFQRILERAVEDSASHLIEEKDADNKPIWNLDLAVMILFESIYSSLGQLASGIEDSNIKLKIPVIMAVDKEGFWIYSLEDTIRMDGYSELEHKWSEKKSYEEVTTGHSQIEQIQKVLEYYINKQNLILNQYGGYYSCLIPELNDEMWGRTIDGISLIAFYQDYPIGIYGNSNSVYAFCAARIYENTNGYVIQEGYYHRANCSLVETKRVEQYLCLKSSCALYGAFPCESCYP